MPNICSLPSSPRIAAGLVFGFWSVGWTKEAICSASRCSLGKHLGASCALISPDNNSRCRKRCKPAPHVQYACVKSRCEEAEVKICTTFWAKNRFLHPDGGMLSYLLRTVWNRSLPTVPCWLVYVLTVLTVRACRHDIMCSAFGLQNHMTKKNNWHTSVCVFAKRCPETQAEVLFFTLIWPPRCVNCIFFACTFTLSAMWARFFPHAPAVHVQHPTPPPSTPQPYCMFPCCVSLSWRCKRRRLNCAWIKFT